MKRLLGGAALLPLLVWSGAIIVRTVFARSVARRVVGHPVPLGATPRVLAVGGGLWRGPAPGEGGYRELRSHGVTTVIDLRSAAESSRSAAAAVAAGLSFVAVPMGDGRAPEPKHYETFAAALAQCADTVFVHCRAGEGRTGALVGAHQIRQGAPVLEATADALAVGSLTFAQLAFMASGGRWRTLPRMLDVLVDRPTEFAFDLLRRPSPGPADRSRHPLNSP